MILFCWNLVFLVLSHWCSRIDQLFYSYPNSPIRWFQFQPCFDEILKLLFLDVQTLWPGLVDQFQHLFLKNKVIEFTWLMVSNINLKISTSILSCLTDKIIDFILFWWHPNFIEYQSTLNLCWWNPKILVLQCANPLIPSCWQISILFPQNKIKNFTLLMISNTNLTIVTSLLFCF